MSDLTAWDKDRLPESADVAVVGAGIIGGAIALRLARAQTDVLLLERSPTIGRGASGVNAGTLSVQVNKWSTWAKYPFPVDLCAESVKQWVAFKDELGQDVDYRRVGGLRVAETEEETQALRQVVHSERDQGLEVELLSGEQARAAEPALSQGIVAASFCDLDGQANPFLATKACLAAAVRAGARLALNCEVTRISTDDVRVKLQTSSGTIRCSTVVLAAGLGTIPLAEQLGLRVPFRVKTNQACVTEEIAPFLSQVVTHFSRSLSLKQLGPGNVLIGGGWDGIPSISPRRPSVCLENLAHNVNDACFVLPSLDSVNIIRAWAGSDLRLDDQLPLLGYLPSDERVLLAVGDKIGFTLAPIIGNLMSELVLTRTTSFPLERFGCSRFAAR